MTHAFARSLALLVALAGGRFLPAATMLQRIETPPLLAGSIHEIGRTNTLYRFERKVESRDGRTEVTRDYTDPKGELVARETATYKSGGLESFKLDERQIFQESSVRVREDGKKKVLEFSRVTNTRKGGKPEVSTEPFAENTITSDMVAPFIQHRWKELTNGVAIKVRFAATQRGETYGFTLSRESEGFYQGRRGVTIRMQPTNWVIAALVDPLFFVHERAEPHHVLEYRGRTAPKLNVGGRWKDLDGVTVFSVPEPSGQAQ